MHNYPNQRSKINMLSGYNAIMRFRKKTLLMISFNGKKNKKRKRRRRQKEMKDEEKRMMMIHKIEEY